MITWFSQSFAALPAHLSTIPKAWVPPFPSHILVTLFIIVSSMLPWKPQISRLTALTKCPWNLHLLPESENYPTVKWKKYWETFAKFPTALQVFKWWHISSGTWHKFQSQSFQFNKCNCCMSFKHLVSYHSPGGRLPMENTLSLLTRFCTSYFSLQFAHSQIYA